MSTREDRAAESLFTPPEAAGDRPPEPVAEQMSSSPPESLDPQPVEHADAIEERDLKPILEALLFIAHEPVTLERLAAALGSVSKAQIRQALDQLRAEYDQAERGVQLVEVAGGVQITTRPELAPWIKAFGKTKTSPKLSRSGLESLAIIAYKQPIVRAEIEAIRGVETSGVLRTLLERKLVRIVGRKDVPGRPIMYGTTKFFLQHFGLRDLSELPPLREFKELGESEQTMLPVGDEPLAVANGNGHVGDEAADHAAPSDVDAIEVPDHS
ncbi:SMC-Scp complex subunit ScpB [Candidatus Nitrospira bockiana]